MGSTFSRSDLISKALQAPTRKILTASVGEARLRVSEKATDGSSVVGAEPSDQALMESIRAGHQESFRILVDRYWTPLLRYASCIVSGRDPAEDVTQEVFIRIWRRRAEWTPLGSVSGYLYRIARNLSLNARRDSAARTSRDQSGGLRLVREQKTPDPHEEFQSAALRQAIEAAIAALPERRREVFILSRYHGLSHREIAEALDISTQTVANQMSNALADLRERLACHLPG